MKKGIRIVSMALVCMLLCSFTLPVFAAETDNYDDYYYQLESGITEIPIQGGATITENKSDENPRMQANGLIGYSVTNIQRTLCNYYEPLTNFATGPCQVTYTSSTSFSISASISAGVGVSAEVLSANLGTTVGTTFTLTASESVRYDVPSGYKGRIVIRYYQTLFNFDWAQTFIGIPISSGSGTAMSGPMSGGYSPYYALQLMQA